MVRSLVLFVLLLHLAKFLLLRLPRVCVLRFLQARFPLVPLLHLVFLELVPSVPGSESEWK